MYRPLLRASGAAPISRALTKQSPCATHRFLSTAPSRRSGSVRGALLRWGLAGAAIYYYNTSNLFADEPRYAIHAPPETARESETYATVDAIAEQRRAQARTSSAKFASSEPHPDQVPAAAGSPDELQEEASQQGAFNEETGEINWDCPCLGGMAHGPCGEQFKAAFSCFVFSKDEPKGIDCIDHFKTMQDCFREHPDVYGAELDGDEELAAPPSEDDTAPVGLQSAVEQAGQKLNEVGDKVGQVGEQVANATVEGINTATDEIQRARERSITAREQVQRDHNEKEKGDHGGELVPKAWHDSTGDNTNAKK